MVAHRKKSNDLKFYLQCDQLMMINDETVNNMFRRTCFLKDQICDRPFGIIHQSVRRSSKLTSLIFVIVYNAVLEFTVVELD